MKEFKASATINASPETVWSIITDAAAYPEFDPSCIRIDGTIEKDGKVTAHTKLSDQAFPVKVAQFEPGKKMMWVGGMPLGLFKGERSFIIESQGSDKVKFTLQEQFSGLLLPLIGRTLPDMNEAFQGFVDGLKARAEAM